MKKTKIIALIMLLSMFNLAACSDRETPSTTTSASPSSQSEPSDISEASVPAPAVQNETPDTDISLADQAAKKKEKNPDAVGWLQVPGTNIDRAVFGVSGDNSYYLHVDEDGNRSYTGELSADYHNYYGDGTAGSLGNVTAIYGMTVYKGTEQTGSADSDSPFGELHKFLDLEFAREHPYLYFSTPEEDMVWQVFAFSAMNISVSYNRNDVSDDTRVYAIGEALISSMYQYGLQVNGDDQILVLSTNIYEFDQPLYKLVASDNQEYRLALFAKRVDAETADRPEIQLDPRMLMEEPTTVPFEPKAEDVPESQVHNTPDNSWWDKPMAVCSPYDLEIVPEGSTYREIAERLGETTDVLMDENITVLQYQVASDRLLFLRFANWDDICPVYGRTLLSSCVPLVSDKYDPESNTAWGYIIDSTPMNMGENMVRISCPAYPYFEVADVIIPEGTAFIESGRAAYKEEFAFGIPFKMIHEPEIMESAPVQVTAKEFVLMAAESSK